MSGGSYDYIGSKMGEAGQNLIGQPDPRRRAIGLLMKKLGKVMHDIEWVDSADRSAGSEHAAIDALLAELAPRQAITEAVTMAEQAKKSLEEQIAIARKLVWMEKLP